MSSGQRYVLETEPAGMKKRCRCSFLLMLKGWELSPKRRELQRVTGCEGLRGERGKTLQRNHLLQRKGGKFCDPPGSNDRQKNLQYYAMVCITGLRRNRFSEIKLNWNVGQPRFICSASGTYSANIPTLALNRRITVIFGLLLQNCSPLYILISV